MTNEALKRSLRATSGIDVALGLWLFVSPWVFGAYARPPAWNSWIVGGAIAIFAAIQLSNPMGLRVWSVLNIVLGAWAFVSPWVYRYTAETDRFVNSLCVGVVVVLLSAYNARGMGHMSPGAPPPVPA